MLNENEINQIGQSVIQASFRVQLDGLLFVLDESVRTKYQTEVFERVQKILDKQRGLMDEEQFSLYKELLESAVLRNEI